jgi:hypothetical protein
MFRPMLNLALALTLAAAPLAQAERAPEAPEARETEEAQAAPKLAIGQELHSWVIEALSPAVDDAGNPTEAPCGYAHNATVTQGVIRRTARIEVFCLDGTQEPGPPLLILGSVIEAVEAPEAPEPPKEPAAEETPAEPEEPQIVVNPHVPEVKPPPRQPFLKGELTNFGTVQLLTHETAVAVALGVSQIEEKFFARVQPELHLDLDKFSLGVGVPLRFEVIDLGGIVDPNGGVFRGAGNFRAEDWDQLEDFLRPLRYLTWGRKEDRVYVDLNRIHAITLGHGQLMRRYSPTIDIDEDNLFAEVDAYSDLGGVELVAGPFPIPRLMGGMVFVKPLGFIDNLYTKSLSFGVSYLIDLNVPPDLTKLPSIADGRDQIPVLGDNELLFPGNEEIAAERVQGLSVDGEIKVYKSDELDVKLYADWSTLIFPGLEEVGLTAFQSQGFTLGSIFRMSFGSKELDAEHSERHKKRADARHAHEDGHDMHHVARADDEETHAVPEHALRARVELRTFDAGFLPSYFDSFYEADKFQFELGGTNPLERAALRTKWRYLHDLQQNEEQRIGAYLELSYLMPGWFGATVSYEDAFALDFFQAKAARNFALHLETNHTEWIKAFATYHYRHFDDFSKMFQFNTDNQVLYLGAKAKVLPFLFIHVGAQRAFRVGFAQDDSRFQEFEIDEADEPVRLTSVGFENQWATDVQVELGWEF